MITTYLILLAGIVLTVGAQILLKLGVSTKGEAVEFTASGLLRLVPQILTNPYLLGALASLAIGLFLWLVVLSRVKLNVAVPFTALNYVLVLFFSWLFLKETVSAIQLAGVATIIFGLFLVIR